MELAVFSNLFRFLLICATCTFVFQARAQSTDAANLAEAAQMFSAFYDRNRAVVVHCVQRFPEARESIGAAWMKFNDNEQRNMFALDIWGAQCRASMDMCAHSHRVEKAATDRLILSLSSRQACEAHFQALANGEDRGKRPKLYGFLEQARPKTGG